MPFDEASLPQTCSASWIWQPSRFCLITLPPTASIPHPILLPITALSNTSLLLCPKSGVKRSSPTSLKALSTLQHRTGEAEALPFSSGSQHCKPRAPCLVQAFAILHVSHVMMGDARRTQGHSKMWVVLGSALYPSQVGCSLLPMLKRRDAVPSLLICRAHKMVNLKQLRGKSSQ